MIAERFSLTNKKAIIVGAGSGIGKATALLFAEVGADIAVAGRTVAKLEEIAGIVRSMGRRALVVPTDLRVGADVDNLVAKTVSEFGSLDVLFNAAGGSFRTKALDMSEGGWNAMLKENLISAFLCSKAAARVMIGQKKGGSIVNTASMAGLYAAPMTSAYAAAKAGLVSMTRSLAVEWAHQGVRVNAISPGLTDTEGITKLKKDDPVRYGVITGRIPMQRAGTPEEMAAAALFLASEASSFITGQTICVDGGPPSDTVSGPMPKE